eukprot:jgi/Tetstr1/463376/TSEL_008298.t1
MDVDNASGNRKDLSSNGEEEPVPDGPVVAANAGAMGEPDRASGLLDDNFWEDYGLLQEGKPAGFLSSLSGSGGDMTDEEPAKEEDEVQEGEQRQQPEAAT